MIVTLRFWNNTMESSIMWDWIVVLSAASGCFAAVDSVDLLVKGELAAEIEREAAALAEPKEEEAEEEEAEESPYFKREDRSLMIVCLPDWIFNVRMLHKSNCSSQIEFCSSVLSLAEEDCCCNLIDSFKACS
ncbi:hypothetical protein WICPIJ_008376 [Wickerhamomyces pijperi]|uniref:Uncharacterized protein n=1 Tax=Wickerhamomyces pijperi TaxID=599730 RepID=A0A9P8THV4_WICPI|nr:hypothetical protein WICPIJ_008376 [Wickerhamomyces pijperi]